MNKEEPYRDQAEKLRQKIEKVNDETMIETGLPSRVDAHRNKKNKTKWKVRFPMIRLLVLFFILLPIVIFSAYSSLVEKDLNSSEKVFSANSGFEQVAFEQKKDNSNELEVEDDLSNDTTSEKEEEQQINENKEEIIEETPKAEDNSNADETEQESTPPSSDSNTEKPVSNENKDSTVEVKEEKEMLYHTVKPNETLFRIAMTYYQSQSGIEIIQNANQLNGNEIKVGQVLKIPK